MDEIQISREFLSRLLEVGIATLALLALLGVVAALLGGVYIAIRSQRNNERMAESISQMAKSLDKKIEVDAVQTSETRRMGDVISAMQADNGKKIEAIHATLTETRNTRTAIDALDSTVKASMESMRAHVTAESAATADKVIAEIKPLLDRLNEIKSESSKATQQYIDSQNALIKRVDSAQETIINELLRLLQKPPAADQQPVTALAIAPAPPAPPPETPDSAQSGDAATVTGNAA